MSETIGYVHSLESFGAVDGPGLRFVVFLQGCRLRCLFCHNPDTWSETGGKEMTSSELITIIRSYRNFIQHGGVTISGGEPLLQPDFCYELTQACHKEKFHVAIDTAGSVPVFKCKKAVDEADMLLLDIKELNNDDCRALTGETNENELKMLDYCEETGKDVWIRHVLVPEYTLNEDKLHKLGEYISKYKCVKKVELLPYHTMGLYKWETLNMKNKLEQQGINPPSDEEVRKANDIIKSYHIETWCT